MKFVSPGMAGVPDRIVILPGGVLWFVELKAPHKKPRALQRFVMRRLRKLGCQVVTIDNKKTVKAFVGLRVRRRDHAVCPTQVSTKRNYPYFVPPWHGGISGYGAGENSDHFDGHTDRNL